jgi:hypothetical protein
MENGIPNEIRTLRIHCYAVWAQERPATFQRLINDTLREYLDDFAITYLDDILIYSDDLEMHRSHVHKVLGKLNERALYVKSQRAGSKQRKLSSLVMLFDLDKSRRTRKRRTQSGTGLRQNESRKYKPSWD